MSLIISILCPCYNEEETIPVFFQKIIPILESLKEPFEIVCVNDGSRDSTLEVLLSFARCDNRVKVLDLSRNFGKEAALTAAIDYALGDAVIPIDVDLQDPPELIPEMVAKWREGYEVILARRIDRSSDSLMKRITAKIFYRFHNIVSRPHLPENVGDFRLMDRCVVEAVKSLHEHHRFMKGLFAWVGFKEWTIGYVRQPRTSGKSKFNAWRLWKFALEGITSFSTFPLTIWLYLGSLISLCSFCYGAFIFFKTIILGIELPGYASSICLILFFGGLQLLGIGIIGEYLGRTYIESKQRPVYIARSF
ncbi:MAG: glycosyltransferase family 2 protein, partial [Synergistaceae bacterium]|nr:glycosyltransferase family 2 protein [Synergistaceae bacterium]